jgi:hypothetical protein
MSPPDVFPIWLHYGTCFGQKCIFDTSESDGPLQSGMLLTGVRALDRLSVRTFWPDRGKVRSWCRCNDTSNAARADARKHLPL